MNAAIRIQTCFRVWRAKARVKELRQEVERRRFLEEGELHRLREQQEKEKLYRQETQGNEQDMFSQVLSPTASAKSSP